MIKLIGFTIIYFHVHGGDIQPLKTGEYGASFPVLFETLEQCETARDIIQPRDTLIRFECFPRLGNQ